MADTFTVFPRLPYDLRTSIWEATFPSRVLKINYRHGGRSWRLAMPHHQLFASEDDERLRYSKYSKSHWDWDCNRIYDDCGQPTGSPAPIKALQVCQESRRFALKAGYRMWDDDNKHKISYWNPQFDVIYMTEGHDRHHRVPLFWQLAPGGHSQEFAERAHLAERLAVPSSLWNGEGKPDENERMAELWKTYKNLKEVTIVLDYAYELGRCGLDRDQNEPPDFGFPPDLTIHRNGLPRNGLSHDGVPGQLGPQDEETARVLMARQTIFPDDIAKDIELCRARFKWTDWKPPRFRLVKSEEQILSPDSVTMGLRCSLSPFVQEQEQLWLGEDEIMKEERKETDSGEDV